MSIQIRDPEIFGLTETSLTACFRVESGGAPDELALLTTEVAFEYAWRTFDDVRGPPDADAPIHHLSTELVVAGLVGWIALGAGICWVSYRRQGARR